LIPLRDAGGRVDDPRCVEGPLAVKSFCPGLTAIPQGGADAVDESVTLRVRLDDGDRSPRPVVT